MQQRWYSMGQLVANLLLVTTIGGILILYPRLPRPNATTFEVEDTSKIRPTAYSAEEIFLPKSLLAKARDEILRGILRERDIARLDAFLEANGLRDAWFVIRYRGIESDGSTWRSTDSNFECKRYHVHSSAMGELENRLNNLEVLSRSLTRACGHEPNTIVSVGQAKDTTVSITRFDSARIILIPNEATVLKYINKNEIDMWRRRAALESR